MRQGGLKVRLAILLLTLCSSFQLSAAISGGEINALRARVASNGEVRVIVQVDAPQHRLGDLAPAARQSHLQAIASQQSRLSSLARTPGLREITRFRTIPFMVFAVNSAALDRLAAIPLVVGLQEDVPEAPALASSVPVMGAPHAWSLGYEGAGQTIAVLDTGVQSSHAFFAPNRVIAEACFSTNQGLVDDRYSMSLCPEGASSSTVSGSGQPCAGSVNPGCGHGTHVAGIVAGNDGAGPNFGVAKSASLISIQVFSCISSLEGCDGVRNLGAYVSDQIQALEHVLLLSENIDISAVNMSLGGSRFSSEASCDQENVARKAVIDNLRSAGIPTIVAAGNNSSRTSLSQPACISTAISVGNTTDADAIAANSNVATFLDLLAPGSQVDSAAVGGGVTSISGTSMAAPHVSGAWAILREAAPGATIEEILAVLQETGESVDDQRLGGEVIDMRRINLGLALDWFLTTSREFEADPAAGSLLDFGEVTVQQTSDPAIITINNTGTASLQVECALQGQQSGSFQILQCPDTVPAAGMAEISLACHPASVGNKGAELQVSSNDEDEPEALFGLACLGMAAPGTVFVDSFEE
jgi:subtilisin family serine protease